jgi:hypothetical protein
VVVDSGCHVPGPFPHPGPSDPYDLDRDDDGIACEASEVGCAMRTDQQAMERAILALLNPERLYCRTEVLTRPSPVPKSPGIYAWYFNELPFGLPQEEFHQCDGFRLLYVGISPCNRTPPSKGNLRSRLRHHFAGNAAGSTLRKTLGCLLSPTLKIELRRVGSGERQTFTNPGERTLDKWIQQHAKVAWSTIESPWLAEDRFLAKMPLPLNLDGNIHPFRPKLVAIRKAAVAVALGAGVIVDNGGPRRLRDLS